VYRNIYRGTAEMYLLDNVALQMTDKLLVRSSRLPTKKMSADALRRNHRPGAVNAQADPDFKRMQPIAHHFALMPLMHSEDVGRHEVLMNLFSQ
jgi:uncharacterized protein (DUF924 family)